MAINDSATTCTNKGEGFWEKIAGCIGKDADGNPTLRFVNSVDTQGNYISCTNKDLGLEVIIDDLFCLDSNGNKAIRVSIENA